MNILNSEVRGKLLNEMVRVDRYSKDLMNAVGFDEPILPRVLIIQSEILKASHALMKNDLASMNEAYDSLKDIFDERLN